MSNVDAPDLWPAPVDGQRLADGVLTALERFLVAPVHSLVKITLWVIATHALDSFNCFPILLLTAATRACGKTRALDVISRLVPRPMTSGSATPAVLFRSAAEKPTILLDELDTWIETDPQIIGFLNNGWEPNKPARRCETVGKQIIVREFPCWGAKAVAMIGLPKSDAFVSRCQVESLRRKLPSEQVERYRHRRPYPELEELRRMAARWAVDHADDLAGYEAPESDFDRLDGRPLDNAEVLAAVADTIGGSWPKRLRDALRAGPVEPDESLVALLLEDLAPLVAEQPEGVTGIYTEKILAHLNGLEERPWPTIRKGDPADANWLRRMFRPFEVRPRQIRVDGRQLRGYDLEELREMLARFLPRPPSGEASQPSHPSQRDARSAHGSLQRDTCDACDGISGGPQETSNTDPTAELF